MADKSLEKIIRSEEKRFGIKDGFQTFSPYPFGGMDQQASRQGMEDNKFFYLENYIKTGPGNLRTLWDKGSSLYTAPVGKTIVYFFFFNLSITNYVAIFLSDGTAIQVNTSTAAQTVISSTLNLFYSGSQLPVCGQWGSQYLIIANNNTANDYWIWDGSVLYGSGTLGPIETLTSSGSGYTSAPSVTIFGGSGSGATATAQIINGSVVSFTITNHGMGYVASDQVNLFFGGGGSDTGAALLPVLAAGVITSVTIINSGSGYGGFTPTLTVVGGGGTGAVLSANMVGGQINSVTISNGGTGYTTVPKIVIQSGLNRAASGSVSLMPFGVSGSSIETFQQRVWLPHPNQSGNTATGGVFLVTAPGSITDFSTSSGGLSFSNTDSFLRAQYTNIKQSNGYLYPISDSSVSVVSNVQTAGNPATTTFNYQNTDPQIGTSWRDSVQPYSRTILFANAFGVFGLYGGAVSKISQQMDNIFDNAVFTGSGTVTPTSAVANIFNLKTYLINLTIKDPFTRAQRTVMVGWDEKEWFIASQSSAFTFIGSQEINSDMFAWGTDGSDLYPLFNTPSVLLTKKLSTKLYGNNNFLIQYGAMGVYAQVQDLSISGSGVVFSSVAVDTEHGSYEVPNIPEIPIATPPYYPVVSMGSGDVFGVNLGLTIASNSADYTINWLGIGYIDIGSVAMSSTPIHGIVDTE